MVSWSGCIKRLSPGRQPAVDACPQSISVVNKELHIAGVLVHCKVDLLTEIRREIAALPGAEVHGASKDGKLVVTLEMQDSTAVLDHINAINLIRGVISATLVYQHNESLDSMREELVHDNHAP